jgi:glycosyltransferase involved in cell wall biosynthesis
MGNELPLVSVCIPTYNGEPFIEDTIRSLLVQTYKNIEILISDNCSIDKTEEIVSKYRKIDSRVIYHKNSENIGYCANVTKCVQLAKSNYIAIYHSDDIYYPTIIEEEINCLVSNKISIVFAKAECLMTNQKRIIPFKYSFLKKVMRNKEVLVGDKSVFFELLIGNGNFLTCPTLMISKDLFLSQGGFTNQYPLAEDLDLWVRILNSGQKIGLINKVLISYRISDTQGSVKLRNNRNRNPFFDIMDQFVHEYGSACNIKKYYKMLAFDMYAIALMASDNSDLDLLKKKIHEIKRMKLTFKNYRIFLLCYCPNFILFIRSLVKKVLKRNK